MKWCKLTKNLQISKNFKYFLFKQIEITIFSLVQFLTCIFILFVCINFNSCNNLTWFIKKTCVKILFCCFCKVCISPDHFNCKSWKNCSLILVKILFLLKMSTAEIMMMILWNVLKNIVYAFWIKQKNHWFFCDLYIYKFFFSRKNINLTYLPF